VKYVSTRGQAPVLDFADVLLTGLASDGGLYVPEAWPDLPDGWDAPRPYADLATDVLWPYVEGSPLGRAELDAMVAAAYATFDHPDVCPLVEIEPGLHVVELFHGPTLAFKDVALQLVGRLFDHELSRRGERATVVVATSGDTGSAAIAACAGRPMLDIVVLHPAGRVSDVQRRQMTTVDAPNVHNVAVEGTFDDCQDLVKALFADATLRDRIGLSAMNSINWARVAAQIVYYVAAAAAVGACDVAVPTGNFGNVFAGWIARRGGAPVERLVIGSNSNDILTRWAGTGELAQLGVIPTLSPSMDIQVSSNHERLLFELLGRDGSAAWGRSRRPPTRRSWPPASTTPPRSTSSPTCTTARATSPTRTRRSASGPPSGAGQRTPRRPCGLSCAWRRHTRPSSPTRSSGPPASAPPCPATWPICSTAPSGTTSSPPTPTPSARTSSAASPVERPYGSGRCLQREDSIEHRRQSVPLHFEVITALQVHPEPLGRAEEAGEAEGRIGADAPLAVDDLVDAARWDADRHRELVLGHPERSEVLLGEDLTRMDRGHGCVRHRRPQW
jgi:threonine synthase